MRQQFVDSSRGMIMDADQDVGEVVDGVDAMLLARSNQLVENSEVLAGLLVPKEKVVRPPQSDSAQRCLRDVVVRRDRRTGRVARVQLGGSDLPDSAVVSCVLGAYQGLSFPSPVDGVVTVMYPIVFSPAA